MLPVQFEDPLEQPSRAEVPGPLEELLHEPGGPHGDHDIVIRIGHPEAVLDHLDHCGLRLDLAELPDERLLGSGIWPIDDVLLDADNAAVIADAAVQEEHDTSFLRPWAGRPSSPWGRSLVPACLSAAR